MALHCVDALPLVAPNAHPSVIFRTSHVTPILSQTQHEEVILAPYERGV